MSEYRDCLHTLTNWCPIVMLIIWAGRLCWHGMKFEISTIISLQRVQLVIAIECCLGTFLPAAAVFSLNEEAELTTAPAYSTSIATSAVVRVIWLTRSVDKFPPITMFSVNIVTVESARSCSCLPDSHPKHPHSMVAQSHSQLTCSGEIPLEYWTTYSQLNKHTDLAADGAPWIP